MIWHAPIGSIHWPSNPGSWSTEDTDFILLVDGREPQIHEVWSLGLDGIVRKVHPAARVEVVSGTAGEFLNNYLAENGCIIQIIEQLSINDSVQFLGVTAQAWGRGFTFLYNLQAPSEATGWISGHYSNQYWGGSMFNSNSIKNVAWGASVDPRPAYLPWSTVNPRAARRHVCYKLLHQTWRVPLESVARFTKSYDRDRKSVV